MTDKPRTIIYVVATTRSAPRRPRDPLLLGRRATRSCVLGSPKASLCAPSLSGPCRRGWRGSSIFAREHQDREEDGRPEDAQPDDPELLAHRVLRSSA